MELCVCFVHFSVRNTKKPCANKKWVELYDMLLNFLILFLFSFLFVWDSVRVFTVLVLHGNAIHRRFVPHAQMPKCPRLLEHSISSFRFLIYGYSLKGTGICSQTQTFFLIMSSVIATCFGPYGPSSDIWKHRNVKDKYKVVQIWLGLICV